MMTEEEKIEKGIAVPFKLTVREDTPFDLGPSFNKIFRKALGNNFDRIVYFIENNIDDSFYELMIYFNDLIAVHGTGKNEPEGFATRDEIEKACKPKKKPRRKGGGTGYEQAMRDAGKDGGKENAARYVIEVPEPENIPPEEKE